MKELGILLDINENDIMIDVRRDSQGLIESGWTLGDTLEQNQALILICFPGELKLDPVVGVGIMNRIADETNDEEYAHRIVDQFQYDGMKINYLEIKNEKLDINARYTDN